MPSIIFAMFVNKYPSSAVQTVTNPVKVYIYTCKTNAGVTSNAQLALQKQMIGSLVQTGIELF